MKFSTDDRIWMQRALDLAREGEGYVSPNPMVGCVIVDKNGNLIGEGYHEKFGKAHAEVQAVKSVSDPSLLEGATVYVTLEPCSHYGKTPPCCEMLGKYPLKRVVAAMKDPNPEVDGKGLKYLKSKGIKTEIGLLEAEAQELNKFFIHHLEFGRPYVILKIAQTADGYIAAPDGESKWISCEQSRALVHEWRSKYDAVMVGRSTALNDNPSLTVRLVEGRQPKRVVIDGPFSLPRSLNLFSDAYEEKTIVITHNKDKADADTDPMLKMLQSDYFRGETIVVERKDGHTDLRSALNQLGSRGITSLLAEGGQALSTALLKEGLVDELRLFISPKILGGGTKSVSGLGVNRMEDIIPPKKFKWTAVGSDMLLTSYL